MNEKPFLHSSLKVCFVAGLAATLLGCAATKSVNETQTDSQACDSLKNVIAQASTNFEVLKSGTGVADYDHTRWDTKSIFPAADCDVIGWGSGKTNYACTWTKADAKSAQNDYSYSIQIAQSCLGAAWVSSPIPGVTGEGVRYSKAGSSVVVDVRKAQELSPSKGWLTSLTVGAPINRNAK